MSHSERGLSAVGPHSQPLRLSGAQERLLRLGFAIVLFATACAISGLVLMYVNVLSGWWSFLTLVPLALAFVCLWLVAGSLRRSGPPFDQGGFRAWLRTSRRPS